MSALFRQPTARRFSVILGCLAVQALGLADSARAINITISYAYDSNNFFNTQVKKDALQAAADRFSDIITTSLVSSSLSDGTTNDPRIGFTHPGTGLNFEISSANSVATDSLATCPTCYPANEYRGAWSIAADQWILYAGGRALGSAAEGGTGTGLNSSSTFSGGSSHLNRGFRASGSVNSLPVWGGVIAFNTGTNWHFGLNTPAPNMTTDFYSLALHEIGHALGLSTGWVDWTGKTDGAGHFIGANAVNAYNADNGTSASLLDEVSASNHHWKDNTYDSYIFYNGDPNLIGTVAVGVKQDLIMEPTANFSGTIRRFEMTNVDVAALDDIGWSVIPQITPPQPGDYNEDGVVNAADYVVWKKGVASGNYATWKANFGESGGSGARAPFSVPEPNWLLLVATSAILSPIVTGGRRRFL